MEQEGNERSGKEKKEAAKGTASKTNTLKERECTEWNKVEKGRETKWN